MLDNFYVRENASNTAAVECIILDAMGVIYQAADDVAELLIPFLRSKGCELSDEEIKNLYTECSLGAFSSQQFWKNTRIPYEASLDEEYIGHHRLTHGVLDFLIKAKENKVKVVCLSNDVSEWSLLLRKKWGLEKYISDWFISGDLSARKPNKTIYLQMMKSLKLPPERCLFLDDRIKNIQAAKDLGFRVMLFGDLVELTDDQLLDYHAVPNFQEVLKCMEYLIRYTNNKKS